MDRVPAPAGNAVMFRYAGLIFGDPTSGLLGQLLQSRKKAGGLFMLLTVDAGPCLFPMVFS
jgi:hypothetical protein